MKGLFLDCIHLKEEQQITVHGYGFLRDLKAYMLLKILPLIPFTTL